MISIIVCLKQPDLLAQFQDNIAATAGVLYELIGIDNRQMQKGICEIYNEGLKRANFNILCFCHEDILFQTKNWGKKLFELLDGNEEIGLAGIAGAVYKSKYPTSWASVPSEFYRTSLIQKKNDGSYMHPPYTANQQASEVAVLDGCFIAGRLDIFNKFKWNENFLKGFHLYDLDICLRVGQKFKLVVINTITIIHLSEGTLDRKWLHESEKTHSYYSVCLPIDKLVTKKQKESLEYYSFYDHALRLIKLRQDKLKVIKAIIYINLAYPFMEKNLSLFKQFIRSL